MKTKLFYVAMALVLVLSFSVGVAIALPAPALANSVSSSTMHFHGDLTDAGGGVYTGTIPMTAGAYYVSGGPGCVGGQTPDSGPCNGGFDVYAREGGTAYVEGTGSYPIGTDHDAYSAAGPWGTWYDPDCADWNQYSLQLTATHWYLRYTPTWESPMSGTLTWNGDGTGYAEETDLGTQDRPQTGLPEGMSPAPLHGGHGGSAAHGGGAQAWDWDCGWGVEVIPLELPGFNIQITPGGSYDVTLTPAAAPAGCFIATAAYSTETAGQLDVLRAFRDQVLLESTVGSQLVALYYDVSPPIADFIADNSLLRTAVRELLIDPIVSLAALTQGIWGN